MSGLLKLLLSLLVCSQTSYGTRRSSYSAHPFHSKDPKDVFESNLRHLTQQAFQQTPQQAFQRTHRPQHTLQRTPQRTPVNSFFRTQPSGQVTTEDIIRQTRTQADSLKRDLRSLTSTPEAASILKKVFAGQSSGCFKSMSEAIQAIETSTKLVENSGTEIKQLVQLVKGFENLSDTPKAVRETAKIIRLLDVLIPKLTPAHSVCRTTSGEVLTSMHSLSLLVDELSSRKDIFFTLQKKQSLTSSAIIVHKVTDFLDHVETSFSQFDNLCTKDKHHNIELINALGVLMNDLADLYTSVGGETAANEIRKQGDFTQKVVANINKLGDIELFSLDCNTPGSSKLVADSLDELAELIEDVGMENLCSQLDLDCSILP